MKHTALLLLMLPFGLMAQKNAVKLNLTSIPLGNYQIQVERQIIPHVAINLSGSMMPSQSIPFSVELKKELDARIDNPDIDLADVHEFIDNAKFGNKSITPELRFYVRRSLKGFYLSVYGRQGSATSEGPSFLQNNGASVGVVKGVTDYRGVGVMLGNQFNIGKRILLDWWIIGAHINTLESEFKLSGNLTAQQQSDLIARLEDIKTELIDYADQAGRTATLTYTVNGSGYTVNTKSPAPGLRMGLSLGIKF